MASFTQKQIDNQADKLLDLVSELEKMKTTLRNSKNNISGALPKDFSDVNKRHTTAADNQIDRIDEDLIAELESLARGISHTASHLLNGDYR